MLPSVSGVYTWQKRECPEALHSNQHVMFTPFCPLWYGIALQGCIHNARLPVHAGHLGSHAFS